MISNLRVQFDSVLFPANAFEGLVGFQRTMLLRLSLMLWSAAKSNISRISQRLPITMQPLERCVPKRKNHELHEFLIRAVREIGG